MKPSSKGAGSTPSLMNAFAARRAAVAPVEDDACTTDDLTLAFADGRYASLVEAALDRYELQGAAYAVALESA